MLVAARRFLATLAISSAVTGISAGCSSSTDPPPGNGCDVSFRAVDAKGAAILTTPFHDGSSDALFWNPALKHLDVLGGDVGDKPARALELELFGQPIADGATVTLGLPDPASPVMPTSRLSFTSAGIDGMRSSAGTVRFSTASASRLVFTVENATMVTLDAQGQPRTDAPSLTMAMTCALDVKTSD